MSSRPRRINALWRLSAVLSLAVSLILSLSPLVAPPVVAAPPETIREAATKPPDITPDSETKPEHPLTTEMRRSPDNQDRVAADAAPNDRVDGDDGSVRLRGVEAPVQLEQKEARGADRPQVNAKSTDEPENEEQQDPGDGPVQKPHAPAKKRIPKRQQSGIRIWPMPAGSYTFTQQFGCVPQLGNLYFPGDGCPADRPVIHTGVDLAAPEGTPFYAAASGWVTLADYDRPTADANTRIIIQHDGRNEGYATDYLHWVASYVKEGDYVHAGDPIGEVGNVGFSTGPHLHFSVTDLGTGEHIDPLRWLPDEPGLEGYISRMPTARLRLPAGTTAGQPESADPAPPEPAVEKVVPESPPVNGRHGGTSGQRSERPRQERRAAANEEPAANDAKRPGKKKSRDGAAPESTTPNSTTDSSTSDATKDRNRSRGQDPTRERTKSDAPPEDAANVDDSGSSDSQANSGKSDRRGNQEIGGKEKGSPDSGGRAAPDTEPPDSSVPDEQGGRHDHNADHQTPDQSERNGGGHQGNGERRPKS